MKILFEEGNQRICTYQDLETWNHFVLSHAPSQWECLIFPHGLNPFSEDTQYLCLSGHIDNQLSWIAKITQNKKREGTWLAGSKLFDTHSESRGLLRVACQKLGIKDSLALDKPLTLSPRFPELVLGNARLANESFVHSKLNPREITPDLLNQITFLAQHAWTRRGAPAVEAHFFKSVFVQLMSSSKLEVFVTKVDQNTRCFVLGFEKHLIAWGALNPDKDQKMLLLLLKYADFTTETQAFSNQPYITEKANESLLLKAWSTFKKPKSYVMTTMGPAIAAREIITFHSDRENLSALSWNLNGTLTGYTTVAKTDSQFVFLTENWCLEKGSSTLIQRLHQLKRELLAKGYLAILADDSGPLDKVELSKLGFVKSPQIPAFRQSNLVPPLLK